MVLYALNLRLKVPANLKKAAPLALFGLGTDLKVQIGQV
jgi:hypothetical protein